jgi:DNA-binding transcriptional LysR family regulator
LLQGEFDVAICNGPGGWPDLEQHFLLATNYTPLCSPRLLVKGKLLPPDALLNLRGFYLSPDQIEED